MGESGPTLRHYDANYGNFRNELYVEIRREAFGQRRRSRFMYLAEKKG